jgi:hypothetical protein
MVVQRPFLPDQKPTTESLMKKPARYIFHIPSGRFITTCEDHHDLDYMLNLLAAGGHDAVEVHTAVSMELYSVSGQRMYRTPEQAQAAAAPGEEIRRRVV